MSGEIIAILGVGVALAGLMLTSSRGLRQGHDPDGVAPGWEDQRAGVPD